MGVVVVKAQLYSVGCPPEEVAFKVVGPCDLRSVVEQFMTACDIAGHQQFYVCDPDGVHLHHLVLLARIAALAEAQASSLASLAEMVPVQLSELPGGGSVHMVSMCVKKVSPPCWH